MDAGADGALPRRFFSSIVSLLQPGRGGSVSIGGQRWGSVHPGDNFERRGDPEKQEPAAEPDIHEENLDRRRWTRTLPPWIHSLHQGEPDDIATPHTQLLPSSPSAARFPHHNHMPIPKPRLHGDKPEQPERFRDAVLDPSDVINDASRWQIFARASAYPRRNGEIVSQEWMDANLPDLDAQWTPAPSEHGSEEDWLWIFDAEKRKAASEHWNRILMRNAFVPLFFRMWVMTFCAASLGLGAWIYHESDKLNSSPAARAGTTAPVGSENDYICEQQTSTYMAFSVNSVALLYLFYVTWDEYFSKPLGLRRTRAKMRLLFLDLFFIIFSAADLSLAFNTLTDQQWSCFHNSIDNNNNLQAARSTCVYSSVLCARQRGLVATVFVSEVAWLMTFTISVLRVVEKISA